MFLSTPTESRLALIPSGRAGIVETLKAMRQMVRDGKKSMRVRGLANSLTLSCGQKDYACEVRKIHAFVRDQIRYVQDINGVETIHSADKVLEFQSGDCDDKCILLASMLESIGHPTKFVAVGFQPGIFSHVYVETKIGNTWIPLETTENVEVGWEPQSIIERIDFFN